MRESIDVHRRCYSLVTQFASSSLPLAVGVAVDRTTRLSAASQGTPPKLLALRPDYSRRKLGRLSSEPVVRDGLRRPDLRDVIATRCVGSPRPTNKQTVHAAVIGLGGGLLSGSPESRGLTALATGSVSSVVAIAVPRNACRDRPGREREEADEEAVAEHAVFSGADDEREERDEEGKTAK